MSAARAHEQPRVDEARLVGDRALVRRHLEPDRVRAARWRECMRDTLEEIGPRRSAGRRSRTGRPNVVGRLEGSGGGRSLMFNGHMDTSYSGREPHLRAKRGFQPRSFVRDGHIWGLGISNMKGALACYVEAVRAIQDAGHRARRRRRDRRRRRRDREVAVGRGVPRRASTAATPPAAATCRPTAGSPTCASSASRPSSGSCSATTARCGRGSRPHGPFIHTAFTAGRLRENAIVRMQRGARRRARLDPRVGAPLGLPRASTASSTSARCAPAQPWRVEPHPRPRRPVPRHPRAADDVDERGARRLRRARARPARAPPRRGHRPPRSTSPRPGAEIDEAPPADRGDRRRARAGLRRAARSATPCAGSRTPRR